MSASTPIVAWRADVHQRVYLLGIPEGRYENQEKKGKFEYDMCA